VACRDPHAILGTSPGATQAQVKAAWRRLAREHHPDLAASPAEQRAATHRMAEINAAYAELTAGSHRRSVRPPVGAASAGGPGGGPGSRPAGPGGPPFERPSGPPPPPPTRPVTARLDTSELLHRRNAATTPEGARLHRGRAANQPPPRARSPQPEPPRASDPTGPAERRQARRQRRRPPSLEQARATEVPFGKFGGRTLAEIAALEPSYVDWIARTITRDPDLVAAARVIVVELDRAGVVRRTHERGRRAGTPADGGEAGSAR